MYWWIPMAAGAVMGAMKNSDDQKASAEDRKLQAIKELWSPFTGQHGSTPMRAKSLMADVGEGAIGGLAQGQAMENAQVKNDYLKAMTASGNTSSGSVNGLPERSQYNLGVTPMRNMYTKEEQARGW
jgi:hypothetical protein